MARQYEPARRPEESSTSDAALIEAARRDVAEAQGRSGPHAPTEIDARFASVTLVSPASSNQGLAGPPSDSLPGYELRREVHRGGQGVVYEAQHTGTKRRVAIKVMCEGPFAGVADRARFEREVRILAQLQHPNIVTVHDTGLAHGCHYFVMDYISGQPLDVYMASADHSVVQTLRLFLKICAAVHAAHVRGIIHRDLKPSNVRVNQDGEPHVLDFGLAKVTAAPDEVAVVTHAGQFVGSVPWASPEQAAGFSDRVDVRSDVYALGVILFQMLTGKFPYEVVGGLRDVLDRILHAEPLRPRHLRREVDDEVETIVLKCLAKEPERRYQSAGELARDIERYLLGDPIEAKRTSLAYVLRKQIHRYRGPAVLLALFLTLLLGGFFTSLTYWMRAVNETHRAENALAAAVQARHEEALQRHLAEQSAHRAGAEAAKAAAINAVLVEILSSADPALARGRDVTVREVLENAANQLDEGALRHAPEVEVAVRTMLGQAFRALGHYQAAETHLRVALTLHGEIAPGESAVRADRLNDLAICRQLQGDFAGAEELFRAALGLRVEHLPGTAAHAESLNNLAVILQLMDRLSEAEPLYQQALELRVRLLGPEHIDVATTRHNFAALLEDRGDYTAAEPLLRGALAAYQARYGDEHPRVATFLHNLASLLARRGAYEEAEVLHREGLRVRRLLFGEQHPDVAASLNNLAVFLHRTGHPAAAEPLYRDALELHRRLLGAEHPSVATGMMNLASVREEQGDRDGAEPLYRAALELRRRFAGGEPRLAVAVTLLFYGRFHQRGGQLAAAVSMYREALEIRRHVLGDTHPEVAETQWMLGGALAEGGEFTTAETHLRQAYQIRRLRLPEEVGRFALVVRDLAAVLLLLDRSEEVVALADECEAALRPAADLFGAGELTQVVELFEQLGRAGTAAEWGKRNPSRSVQGPL